MKKIKKTGIIILVVIMVICAIPAFSIEATSYPRCMLQSSDLYASVGDFVPLSFLYSPSYTNEESIIEIYDSNENLVGSCSHTFHNLYSVMSNYTVDLDTKKLGLTAGEYKIVSKMKFYSLYDWHWAPSDSIAYFNLVDDSKIGAADKNKYTGSQEYFNIPQNKSKTLTSNDICTAESAWNKNTISDKKYTIQLQELYLGDKAEEIVKNENMFNSSSSLYDQWMLMNFKITNNNTTSLDPSDILFPYGSYGNFCKYTGYPLCVLNTAVFSDSKNDIYDGDIAPNETKNIWVGMRVLNSNGMPYIKLKSGSKYVYLNVNPDFVTGKKTNSHSYTTSITKATTLKDGKIVKKCSFCGKSNSTPIYKASSIKLSATSCTYDGKVKKPKVTVKDSKGKTISASSYTVSYAKGRKNVGKYAVKITFKGNYSGTKTLYFTIKPKNTSISKVTAGKKSFKVNIKKYTTQTTGYQIQYGTSSGFKGAKTVTIGNKTTAKTISKLKANKKYYVRIRTYKAVGKTKYYSAWSKSKSVKTKK